MMYQINILHSLETLLNFLRTEQRGTIRGQTLRLLGLLGALDPYRHKMAIGQIGMLVLPVKNLVLVL